MDYVNKYFPDVLPLSVLEHYGYDSRPVGDLSGDVLYQQRSRSLSNRELLEYAANELDARALTAEEKEGLKLFKEQLAKLEDAQRQRAELGVRYKEQQFGKGSDRAEAQKTLERMKIMDKRVDRISK